MLKLSSFCVIFLSKASKKNAMKQQQLTVVEVVKAKIT